VEKRNTFQAAVLVGNIHDRHIARLQYMWT
jgi:hypothetical protein